MAGRKKNTWHGAREARAAFELQAQFDELSQAANAFRDQGDYERLEVAIDRLRLDTEFRGFPPLAGNMPRDQRIAALAGRYSTTSYMLTALADIFNRTEALRRQLGDELRDAIIEPSDDVPAYARQFLQALQAANIEQSDLRSAPRALAEVAAKAIRDYNEGSRRPPDATQERYLDHPVGEWSSLPNTFAGVTLIRILPGKEKWPVPFPLPGTTDIADYTVDRTRPPTGEDRRKTIIAWSKVITQWATARGSPMTGLQPAAWALLLGHRLKWDESDIGNLNGVELQSPWNPKETVRIEVLKEPEDDVPY